MRAFLLNLAIGQVLQSTLLSETGLDVEPPIGTVFRTPVSFAESELGAPTGGRFKVGKLFKKSFEQKSLARKASELLKEYFDHGMISTTYNDAKKEIKKAKQRPQGAGQKSEQHTFHKYIEEILEKYDVASKKASKLSRMDEDAPQDNVPLASTGRSVNARGEYAPEKEWDPNVEALSAWLEANILAQDLPGLIRFLQAGPETEMFELDRRKDAVVQLDVFFDDVAATKPPQYPNTAVQTVKMLVWTINPREDGKSGSPRERYMHEVRELNKWKQMAQNWKKLREDGLTGDRFSPELGIYMHALLKARPLEYDEASVEARSRSGRDAGNAVQQDMSEHGPRPHAIQEDGPELEPRPHSNCLDELKGIFHSVGAFFQGDVGLDSWNDHHDTKGVENDGSNWDDKAAAAFLKWTGMPHL